MTSLGSVFQSSAILNVKEFVPHAEVELPVF